MSDHLRALLQLNIFGKRRRVIQMLADGTAPEEILSQLKEESLRRESQGPIQREEPIDEENVREENFLAQFPAFALGKSWRDPDPAQNHSWTAKFNPDKEIDLCKKNGIKFLDWLDPEYPSLLKEIAAPPLVLYYQGSYEETDEAAAAIVGTRNPSFYGITQAKQFAAELARAGLTIVSGFAKGIDQVSHEAALGISHGRTIAVLGCGQDIEYPKGAKSLFRRITEHGAVITEYPLGTPPQPENFPKRNRIIAGLSLAVLVIEAASRSGSLITAREATDQGREVFALPGPVDRLTSRGTHSLIKEGAYLVDSPWDILTALASSLRYIHRGKIRNLELKSVPASTESASTEEEEWLLKTLEKGPKTYEEVVQSASVGSSELALLLVNLELKKKIQKSQTGKFMLNNPL